MTATNHTIAGAIVGLSVHQPIVAIPVAFFLHFMLDALPHYGLDDHMTRKFKIVLFTDMFVAMCVLLLLVIMQPDYWLHAVICGIACASPDLMWLPHWIRELMKSKKHRLNIVEKFHSNIQRYELSKNYPYEFLWFFIGVLVLVKLI